MNSVKIAKKLIEENEKDIEDFREAEARLRKRIEECKKDIEKYELLLKAKQHALEMLEEDLQRKREQKEEYLVDNCALRMFVLNDGVLD